MDLNQYILVEEFCSCHKVQQSFVSSLSDYGLVNVIVIEDHEYIDKEQVEHLEKMKRLHYDLEINMEGIDAINHLLGRVSNLQNEVRRLQNRLRRYED